MVKLDMKVRGFGLLELLICLGICSTLLLCSVLSLRTTQQSNQALVIKNTIEEAIQFSKLMALSSQTAFKLTPSDFNDWRSGLSLWKLVNKKAELIRQWQWPKSVIAIDWHGFQSHKALLFGPYLDQFAVNGRFMIHLPSSSIVMTLNRLGRIQSVVKNHQ